MGDRKPGRGRPSGRRGGEHKGREGKNRGRVGGGGDGKALLGEKCRLFLFFSIDVIPLKLI